MKHQDEHIQVAVADTVADRMVVAAAGRNCSLAGESVEAEERHIAVADMTAAVRLTAIHIDFAGAGIATEAVDMGVEEMRPGEEEAAVLEDRASVAEGSQVDSEDEIDMEAAEVGLERRHPDQLLQVARIYS